MVTAIAERCFEMGSRCRCAEKDGSPGRSGEPGSEARPLNPDHLVLCAESLQHPMGGRSRMVVSTCRSCDGNESLTFG